MAAVLRRQRAQRRAIEPCVSARHEGAELGAHRFHQQRERDQYPRRDDPLRHDEDRAAGRLAGLAESCTCTAVTVNAVLPGPTRSAGVEEFAGQLSGGKPFAEFEKEFFTTVRPSSLLKRFAMTEEVANLVTYVCSPLSAATNGAALRVDGGVVQACF